MQPYCLTKHHNLLSLQVKRFYLYVQNQVLFLRAIENSVREKKQKKNITNVDWKNLYVEFGITSNRVIEINASDPCDIPYGKNNVKHVRKLANNAIATKTCCG